jgi:hypothetical protein
MREGGASMRKTILVLAVGTVAVLIAAGAAFAAGRIECPNRADGSCVGTERADEIMGSVDPDEIHAKGGPDIVRGKTRADLIYGGRGDDRIEVGECYRDRAFGGRGDDRIDVYDACWSAPEDPPTPTEMRDFVDCGPGFDVVLNVRPEDRIAGDCERKVESAF